VTALKILAAFESFNLYKLHMPLSDPNVRLPQAFLEFQTASDRRKAHTLNETYVEDCQLQLHYTSSFSLEEAKRQSTYEAFLMASYILKKKAGEMMNQSSTDDVSGAGGCAAAGFGAASVGSGSNTVSGGLNPDTPSWVPWQQTVMPQQMIPHNALQAVYQQWDKSKQQALGAAEASDSRRFAAAGGGASAAKGVPIGAGPGHAPSPMPNSRELAPISHKEFVWGGGGQKREAAAAACTSEAYLSMRISLDPAVVTRHGLLTDEQVKLLKDFQAFLQQSFEKPIAKPTKNAVIRLQFKDELPDRDRQALLKKMKESQATHAAIVGACGVG